MDVYRNLNKPGVTFSMRERGRVIGHTQSITLVGCTFKHATQSQQANCRLRRLVCQWVKGTKTTDVPADLEWVSLSCDPKKCDGFQVQGRRIESARFVRLDDTGCFAVL